MYFNVIQDKEKFNLNYPYLWDFLFNNLNFVIKYKNGSSELINSPSSHFDIGYNNRLTYREMINFHIIRNNTNEFFNLFEIFDFDLNEEI